MHSLRTLSVRSLTYLTSPSSAKRWSSSSAASEIASARNYCSELLKKYDAPSYTLLAFIPPSSQTAYLAIRALNLEIARIPDTVSASHVGALRYQFWKDQIRLALSGSPPKHPVPILLSAAAEDLDRRSSGKAKFSRSWATRVVSTREQYADGSPMANMGALESYAENTYSTLMYLTLQALPMASVAADHVASHVGKAAGIVTVLRGLPLLAFPGPGNSHANSAGLSQGVQEQRERSRQGVVNLPLDVMAEAGVREEDVLRYGAEAEGLRDAVFKVATRASDHLITARTMVLNLRRGEEVGHEFEHALEEEHVSEERPATVNQQLVDVERAFGVYMPAVSTGLWLDRLQSVDFDIFSPELRKREWKLPWKAFVASRQKKF